MGRLLLAGRRRGSGRLRDLDGAGARTVEQRGRDGAIADALARMPRAWAWVWLAARAIGSVIIVPVAEELAFRGYLTRRLIAADFQAVPEGRFTWPSFLLSSLLFGLLHQRWLAGTVAGMAYALAYYRRGKLIDAIWAHAMTNLSITISVFATECME